MVRTLLATLTRRDRPSDGARHGAEAGHSVARGDVHRSAEPDAFLDELAFMKRRACWRAAERSALAKRG